MNNRINFTGIHNIGAASCKFQNEDNPDANLLNRNQVSFFLSDDKDGHDLTEFTTAMNRSKLPWGRDFLENLDFVCVATRSEDGNPYSVPKLSINFEDVPVNNDTMPIFTYIAKLMLKISSLPDKNLETPNVYKYGTLADATLFGYAKVSDIVKDANARKEVLDNAYSPNIVRLYSEKINNDIQKQMVDYFL